MYEEKLWLDHVTEFEDRYREQTNADGTITHIPVEGEVLQQGTPQNAQNFNHMETGISEAHALAGLLVISAIHQGQKLDDLAGETIQVTLTNSESYPFNNSQKTVALGTNRNNLNYTTLVKKVSIVPLEVIVRNIAAGSFAKHYGVAEGVVFDQPTIEFSYKNDALGDPLLNTSHALALKIASREEIETIRAYALRVNELLKAFWKSCGVTLVDFKLEFGRLSDGTIVLADEISPDTSRLWDSATGEKLDKDRFRRDLGGVEEAYAEIMRRLEAHL